MVSLITASDLDWPIVPGPCGADGPDGISDEQWEAAQQSAVAWLWALSGRRFGTWTVVFRPEWTVPIPREQHVFPGYPYGPRFGCLPARLSTNPTTRAPLPGPVVSVSEVKVDGDVADPGVYMVERDQLIRTDGGTWPGYQDTTKPLTEPGTWQISYVRGADVPAGGQAAAGVLACEIAAALTGGKCSLPSNTQQVARNGVTISRAANQLQLGFTGLASVDQWARTVNPKGYQSQPMVWSSDLDPDFLPPPPGV